MQFVKAHGTGNDFVLLPDPDGALALTPPFVRALCHRHLGVGADGVIRLAPAGAEADVFMDYRNADGSIAEMCGNGVRCVAKYMADRAGLVGDVLRVDTRAGVKVVEIIDRHPDGTVARVRVDMGAPLAAETTTVVLEDRPVELTTVSMGNPHAVLVVEDVDAAPLDEWAPALARQYEGGINVEVITVLAPHKIRGRVFERGVGETLASGTGVSAMAVAAAVRGLAEHDVTVSVPGGDLDVAWTDETLFVTGPVEEVATGTLTGHWLALAGVAQPEQAV